MQDEHARARLYTAVRLIPDIDYGKAEKHAISEQDKFFSHVQTNSSSGSFTSRITILVSIEVEDLG